MALNAFPDIESADNSGLLALGGNLDVETLITAYSSGIFPWPFDENVLAWFSPPKRAILFLEKHHSSKRLLRIIKQGKYKIKIDANFEAVIRACAKSKNRTGQKGTWITEEMIEAYCRLHKAGYTHSIECYIDDKLSGGVYGVALGKFFAGESMFYIHPYASQIAFFHLVEMLRAQGAEIIDCQVMTPHSKKFGAEDIKRNKFINILNRLIKMEDLNFKI